MPSLLSIYPLFRYFYLSMLFDEGPEYLFRSAFFHLVPAALGQNKDNLLNAYPQEHTLFAQ